MAKKKIKKRVIVLLSLLGTFVTAVVLFCAITGFNLKTFIFGTHATGNEVISETDLETTTKALPTDGSTPEDYDALSNFAFFAYKLEHSCFEATTNGKASAKYNGMNVDQKVYDYRLKSGDYILTDTRSTSTFVKVYQEQFFTSSKVLYRSGKTSNYDSLTCKARSLEQEFKLYGLGPEKIIGYIVCSETLKANDGVNKNDDGTYTSTYTLDPTVAPAYYQRKVKTNASISDFPNFVSVKLQYTYDSEWNIISANYREVYSIYKMKSWIETSTNITETFTYLSEDEAESKISNKYNYYKKYFNLDVSDDSADEPQSGEMAALDYLGTMANLINEDYLYFNVKIKINNKETDVKIAICMLDRSAEIQLDGLVLVYKNNKVYIKGDISGYYDVNTFLSYLGLDSIDVSSSSLDMKSFPFNTDKLIDDIMSNINDGVVSHDGSNTYVDIDFEFGNITIPARFTFYTPDENTIEFVSIIADYTEGTDTFRLEFEIAEKFDSTFVDGQYAEFAYALDVNMSATLTLGESSYELTGMIYMDALSKAIDADLSLTDGTNTLSLNCTYKDDYLYIALKDKLYFKISKDEIIALINESSTNTQDLDFDTSALSYELLREYIKNISFTANDSFVVNYNSEISLGAAVISNISFEIKPRYDYQEVEIDSYDYISYTDCKELIDNAIALSNDIIASNGLTATINATYLDYTINGSLYYKIDTNSVKAILNVSYNESTLDVVVFMVDNFLYIECENINLKLCINDLMNSIPKSNSSVDLNKLVDIFGIITYTDSLNILLNTTDILGFDLNAMVTNNLNVTITSTDLNVVIEDIKAYSELIALDKTINYVDASKYVDNVLDILEIVKNKSFIVEFDQVNLSISKYDLLISGEIRVNEKNLLGTITIDYEKYSIDVALKMIDNVIYATIFNQTFVIDLANLDTFLTDVLGKVNTILDTTYTLDLSNTIDVGMVFELIKGILITDDFISVDFNNILGKSLMLVLALTTTNSEVDANISTSGAVLCDGLIKIYPSTPTQIVAPTENLLDEASIKSILDYAVAAKKLVDNDLYSININELVIEMSSSDDYFDITGSVQINLIDGLNDFDAIADLIICEYRNGKKYGWHQVHITVVSSKTSGGEAYCYATYGNNESNKSKLVKVYSSYTGVKAMISAVMDLMKIDTFSNMLSDGSSKLDINSLINSIAVSDTSLDLVLEQMAINKFIPTSSLIQLSITKNDSRITNLEASNFYISYTTARDYIRIKSADIELVSIEELSVSAPVDTNDYYDISNMSYLFKDLYNDAQMKDFEISGSVSLSIGSFFTSTIPLNIKVHVCDDGSPEVFISLNIPKIAVLVTFCEKKTLNIYYKDGFIYQNRIDADGDNYLVKLSLEAYTSDLLNLLMGDYGFGMNSMIMGLITGIKSEGDGFVDAADCVNSVDMGTTSFSFSLNLGEIIDNSSIKNMDVTLGTRTILWTNEDGSLEHRDILSKIENFTLDIASMVSVSGSGLEIVNIDSSTDDNIVTAVDMNDYYTFIESFAQNYDVDTYYKGSNGTYKYVDKISHTASFDFDDVIDRVSTSYYAGMSVSFPYQSGDVIYTDGKYYQVMGWYSDATYQHLIDEPNIIMPAKKMTYYAKLKDVTDVVSNSVFEVIYGGNVYTITPTSTSMVISDDAAIFDGKNYLLYNSSKLTGEFLITKYLSYFDFDSEANTFSLRLYSLFELAGYKSLSFDILDSFNEKGYKAVYFEDSIRISDYLPKGTNGSLEVDYWTNNDILITDFGTIDSSMSMVAHYSTVEGLFIISGSTISEYIGTDTIVITPKYILVDGEYITPTIIGDSAFYNHTEIVNLVLNDGIVSIESNAFKNCSSLRNIYFSDTVNNVASDAFYIANSGSYEDNRDICESIRFYFAQDSAIKESSLKSWIACKHTLYTSYYETSRSKVFGLGGGDFTNAYQTYTGDIDTIIENVLS